MAYDVTQSETYQPSDERGLDLDTLLAELTKLREQCGNVPVVVYEDRQSKYLGLEGVSVRPGNRGPVVVLDGEEGERPESTWGWED